MQEESLNILHLGPHSSAFHAFNRRVDECHPRDAIVHARKIATLRNSLSGDFGLYGSHCFGVYVCESFNIAFRLPSNQASNSSSDIANVIVPRRSVLRETFAYLTMSSFGCS